MPIALEESQTDLTEATTHAALKPATHRVDARISAEATVDAETEAALLPPHLCRYGLSRMRVRPETSSFLRSGLEFTGTQQSGRAVYEVNVSLKYVDLAESFLCGFLRISGLSEDHPTLTTYFEGEIIGSKYSFITRNPNWNSTEQIDIEHWARFAAFKPIAPSLRSARMNQRNHRGGDHGFRNQDHVFMRWKELQILPNDSSPGIDTTMPPHTPATGANATQTYRDRRTRNLEGVSYAGFYYICLDQRNGVVNGMYYHQNSELYQQLQLSLVSEKGRRFDTFEFR